MNPSNVAGYGLTCHGSVIPDVGAASALDKPPGHEALKAKVAAFVYDNKKFPLNLRTALNISDVDCIRYIQKIPKTENSESKKIAIKSIVDDLLSSELTQDQLKIIEKSILTPELKKKQLNIEDLDALGVKRKSIPTKNNDATLDHVSLSNLSWNSHPVAASNESRLIAINHVLDWIYSHYSNFSNRKLTLVSLGSGCLLMEHLIYQSLLEMGIPKDKIQWRCIDPCYLQAMAPDPVNFYDNKKARDQFKTDKHVRYFSTAKTYLNKTIDSQSLPTVDREQGTVVILAFNPPSVLDEKSSHIKEADFIIGSKCDLEKANSIYLLLGGAKDQAQLNEAIDQISPGKIISIERSPALKAYINHSGQLTLQTNNALKLTLNDSSFSKIKPTVTRYFDEPDSGKSDIHRTFDALNKLAEIFKQSKIATVVFPLSCFPESVSQLAHYFYDQPASTKSSGALFELKYSKVTIKTGEEFKHT